MNEKNIRLFNINFTKEIVKYPCIYDDSRTPSPCELQEAWQAIGTAVDMTVEACRATWLDIQKKYNRSMRNGVPIRKPHYLTEAMAPILKVKRQNQFVQSNLRDIETNEKDSPDTHDTKGFSSDESLTFTIKELDSFVKESAKDETNKEDHLKCDETPEEIHNQKNKDSSISTQSVSKETEKLIHSKLSFTNYDKNKTKENTFKIKTLIGTKHSSIKGNKSEVRHTPSSSKNVEEYTQEPEIVGNSSVSESERPLKRTVDEGIVRKYLDTIVDELIEMNDVQFTLFKRKCFKVIDDCKKKPV